MYQLTQDFIYEFGDTYEGQATKTRFSFDAPIVGTQEYAQRMIAEFENQCQAEGARMLRLKVWEDHSPPTKTPFLVEFTASGSFIPVPVIMRILTLVIVAIIGFLIYYVVKSIVDMDWPKLEPALSALKWVAIATGVVAVAYIVSKASKIAPAKKKVPAKK